MYLTKRMNFSGVPVYGMLYSKLQCTEETFSTTENLNDTGYLSRVYEKGWVFSLSRILQISEIIMQIQWIKPDLVLKIKRLRFIQKVLRNTSRVKWAWIFQAISENRIRVLQEHVNLHRHYLKWVTNSYFFSILV